MKRLLLAIACTALFASSAVMARDGYDGGHSNRDRHGYSERRGDHHSDRDHRGDHRRDDRRHRDVDYAYRYDGHHDRGRHSWRRGGYYHNSGYVVVHDYGRYNLHHPHRGYRWVRDGRDYLLVAVATGLIADVVWNGY